MSLELNQIKERLDKIFDKVDITDYTLNNDGSIHTLFLNIQDVSFKNQSTVEQHRSVFRALGSMMQKIHAISVKTSF